MKCFPLWVSIRLASIQSVSRRGAAVALLMLPGLGWANEAQRLEPLYEAARRFLYVQLANYGDRATFSLATLDKRIALAPCNRLEAQLPAGNRLVGNTVLRIQCLAGAKWSISLPVSISIQTDYWVAARALSSGHELTENDLEQRSGDLSQLPVGLITDRAAALGRSILGGVAAGAPIRSDLLRAPYIVRANEFVRVVAKGQGFEVASEGRALNSATEGQPVSVRMISGATVKGVAKAGGTVEVLY